ncbi:MAG: universal stress protein [Geminicoccaceae bacterium]
MKASAVSATGTASSIWLVRPGKAVDEILRTADELEANLIVTVTEGHHVFLDALRGSTTEQIVRRAPLPRPRRACRRLNRVVGVSG